MGDSAPGTETSSNGVEKPAENAGAPAPVPYAVFKTTNDRVKALESELAGVRGELTQYGKAKVEELTATLSKHESMHGQKLALARAGVTQDAYLDYLASRYNGLPEQGRPVFDEWLGKMKADEPAFFGGASAAANGNQPPNVQPPKTNPDATVEKPAPGGMMDQPISDDWLKTCSQSDYNRRRPEILAYQAEKRRGSRR